MAQRNWRRMISPNTALAASIVCVAVIAGMWAAMPNEPAWVGPIVAALTGLALSIALMRQRQPPQPDKPQNTYSIVKTALDSFRAKLKHSGIESEFGYLPVVVNCSNGRCLIQFGPGRSGRVVWLEIPALALPDDATYDLLRDCYIQAALDNVDDDDDVTDLEPV